MKSVKINIKLPSNNELQKEIQQAVKLMEKYSLLEMKIDTKSFTKSLSSMSNELAKLKTQLSKFDVLDNLSNSTKVNDNTKAIKSQTEALKEQIKVQEILKGGTVLKTSQTEQVNNGGTKDLIKDYQTIKLLSGEIVQVMNTYDAKTKEIVGTIITTTNEIEKQRQAEEKIANTIANMQNKLSQASTNGLINPSVISDLGNKLNSINTDTSENEIKQLQQAINNLSSSDKNIVRLQNAISSMENSLKSTRGKYGSLVNINDLKKSTDEINRLKQLLGDLMNGKVISSSKLTSEINKGSNALKEMTTNCKTSSSAIKTASQDASDFGSAIQRAFANTGIFLSTATAIRSITNELKNASSYIIELDERLTNIQMITGKSSSSVEAITNDFKNLGKELHTTNSELMAGAEEILRAGYDLTTAKQMMEASIIGAKISGQTTATVTEQLIAIKNAFNLEGSSMSNVIDIISKMDDTSATSFREIAEAIQRTAYSAQQANTPLENLVAYITTVSEKTRRSAETIGESFKSIYSRYSNIKLGNMDDEGKSINDVETALARVDIKLRDSVNSFRDFDDVLLEFVEKYQKGTMAQTDYLAVVNTLAGTRQKETLMALVENFDAVKKHQDDMTASIGSAKSKFDDVYSDSLDAKINDLKRSFEGLYETLLNSSSLGIGIEAMTSVIDGISNVGNTLGVLPTSIVSVVTALTLFNSKFRESSAVMTSFIPGISSIQTNLKLFEKDLTNQVSTLKLNISSIKDYVNSTDKMGHPIANAGKELLGLNTKLALTTAKLVATKVASVALSSVLSMGLSLAIATMVSAVGKGVTSLANLGKELKEFNAEYSNLGGDTGNFDYLLSRYETLKGELNNLKQGTQEYSDVESNLKDIQEILVGVYGDKIVMIENDTSAKEINLEKTKELNKEEQILAETRAKNVLDKNFVKDTEDIDKTIEKYKEAYKLLEDYNSKSNTNILANLGDTGKIDASFIETLKTGGDLLPILTDNAEESTEQLKALYEATGVMALADKKWEEAHYKLGSALGYTRDEIYNTQSEVEGLKDSTGDDPLSGLKDSAEDAEASIKNLNDTLSGLKNTNEIIKQAIEEFTAYGELSEQTFDKILSSGTPEMVTALQDANTFLETYNRLLVEGEELEENQRQAIINKNNEILNLANTTADVIDQNATNYNIDADNYAKANESKIENSILFTNKTIDETANATTQNGKNYVTDQENFRGIMQGKLGIADDFANGAMSGIATFVTNAGENYVRDSDNFVTQVNVKIEAMRRLQETLDTFASNKIEFGGGRGILKPTDTALKDMGIIINKTGGGSYVNASKGGGYVGGSANRVNNGVGHGANSSNGSGLGSGSTAKEIEDLEDLTDRYYNYEDAIEDVNNALEITKHLRENSYGIEKIKYMQKEIDLYKQQQKAIENYINAYKKEQQEIKNSIVSQGAKVDSNGNITNYNELLNSKRNWANSLSGSAKENAIDSVKDLEESLKRYTELTNNLIPSMEKEWQSLGSTIKSVYKEQAEVISKVEQDIYETIKYYAERTTETKQKELQKQIDLLNKSYDDEAEEEALNKQRQTVTELLNEMAKYESSVDAKGKAKYQQLLAEYEEQQAELNNMIKEAQKEYMIAGIEEEKDKLDEELEDLLSPANMNKLIADALSSGMVEIGGEVVDLSKAMSTMLQETTIGTQTLIQANNEWVNSLKEATGLYSNISDINSKLGLTSISGLSGRNVDNRAITIQVSVPEVAGGVTGQDVANEIKKALKEYDNKFK